MLQRLYAVNTWAALTTTLESQFGPSPFDCPMVKLFKLQQTTTVSEYYLKFMTLANRSSGLQDDALLNCFLSGLQVEIRCDVVSQSPLSLLRAVALAKLYEERYITVPKSSTPSIRRYSPVYGSAHTTSYQLVKTLTKSTLPPLLSTPNTPPLKDPTVKKIRLAEMQLRRDKGLCYFCDEKFSFNHKCHNRRFPFLQLEESSMEGDKDSPDTGQSVLIEEPLIEDHHLSLNALKGGIDVGTIRFLTYVR